MDANMNDKLTVVKWYDLDPYAGELCVVEGPDGYSVEDIDPDNLPPGFRWVYDEEYADRDDDIEIIY